MEGSYIHKIVINKLDGVAQIVTVLHSDPFENIAYVIMSAYRDVEYIKTSTNGVLYFQELPKVPVDIETVIK
jgi:hypothetical protein